MALGGVEKLEEALGRPKYALPCDLQELNIKVEMIDVGECQKKYRSNMHQMRVHLQLFSPNQLLAVRVLKV